ncbi:ion channel protein [Rhizoctonia solani 123E]|uniref:Ion channel protein n=1 Tax=Rhizoctonia solani 123E TaxID=1423351 RepID=A0A074RGZ7_9AGAM|nr:ion channel protein [Rhizoctonia solani 123E]
MTQSRKSTDKSPGKTSWISAVLRPIYLFASVSPLTAALIAPLAVLLDIPALTEKWYNRNGEPQPDPRASLILSGLSLGFSLIANALLVVRFSLQGTGWKIATRISVACWFIKVVTGICNLVVFGALTRNQPQFSYAEGFWSAVVSVIASGIVLALLLLHWSLEFKRDPSKDDQPSASSHTKLQIRVAGRHFMLQNTMLIALIALTALIFSRTGIYFTIVTFLTIGFGDFYPSRPSTKVLLFFLGLLGITLLASCISMIVSFFNDHQREHKAKARAEREKAWHMSQMKTDNPSLQREIAFLSELHQRQGWRERGVDLLESLAGFLVFWFVGAAIFSAVESWPYGDGLYFCYVFFLSIGYGDLAPVSPAGRVIFIVYSLMAVPIMASFAVQAIQNILERLSEQRMDRRRAEMGDETSQAIAEVQLREKKSENNGNKESPDEMHSTLVARFHSQKGGADDDNTDVAMNAEDLKALLDYAVSLERVARRLLVAHLAEGSPAQILLRADWNLQSRDLRLLESESQGRSSGQPRVGNGFGNESKADGAHRARMKGLAAIEAGVAGTAESREEREEEEIAVTAVGGMDDEETLKAVREFRRNVAGMLALGSRLKELEVRPCMIYLELF